MNAGKAALVVVDMQRYYLDPGSDFHRYAESRCEGAMDHIRSRCVSTVIPSISRLIALFRDRSLPIAFFRLCGARADRGDLHRFFRSEHEKAAVAGFANLYPLSDDPYSDVIPELAPLPGDPVFDKTGFGGFADGRACAKLESLGVTTLFFAGLATSQCVDTSARGASDRGFAIVHVEDAQADYSVEMHQASLYASCGVCGGNVVDTHDVQTHWDLILRDAL